LDQTLGIEDVVEELLVDWRSQTASRIPSLLSGVTVDAAVSSVAVVVSRGDVIEG